MPATSPVHTIDDFLRAYERSVRGRRDALADVRRGSAYELAGGGPGAILWSRQSQRDRELFRRIYLDTARGDDLDGRVEKWLSATRVQASAGVGTAVLERPTAAVGGGTIYAGTRILVRSTASQLPPVPYAVAEDTAVGAAALSVPVPIRATRTGTGVAVQAEAAQLQIDDELFDATFACTSLVCANGTDKEPDPDYLARARQAKLDSRVGYQKAIERVCLDAGAGYVVALDAGALGDDLDVGLNYVYVADAAFVTTDALVKACVLALEHVRVEGCDLQVLGMAQTALTAAATLHLYDDPGQFDTEDLAATARAVLLDAFNRRPKFWTFRLDELRGALLDISDAVQSADIATSPGEPAIAFPAVLPRYTLQPGDIAVSFTGPV